MTNPQRLKKNESIGIRKIAKGPGLDCLAVRHLSREMTLPFRLKKRSKRLESAAPLPRKAQLEGFIQLSRAATPHTITGPKLPYGAPFGPVMYPSLANFKMRNSSVRRPR